MNRELPLYLLGALLIHGAVLWAWARTPVALIGTQESPAVEVELSEERTQAALPEPVKTRPQSELPPPAPEKRADSEAPPEPEPEAEAMVPEPQPTPAVKPTPRVITETPRATPQPSPATTRSSTAPAASQAPAASSAPAGSAKDRSHATWKHRVTPSYPASALQARKAGRVLVTVQVNALGQATAASVTASSGNPVLDAAAVRAARESTYLPKCLLGVPLPDTVAIPYNFDIRSR